MNFISFPSFVKDQKSTGILICYYLSKIFFNVETKEGGLNKIQINVQEIINTVSKHSENGDLTCKTSIPYIVKILNKIYIPVTFYDNDAAKFYDNFHVESFKL